MDEQEALCIRKMLLITILQDGKANSIDHAIKVAEQAYNWIIKGPATTDGNRSY